MDRNLMEQLRRANDLLEAELRAEVPTPVITVNVPEQPAPVVQVAVNVPEQQPPVVNVSVPAQAAPVVNVDLKIPDPEPVQLVVERDWNGNIKSIREE